MSRARSEQWGQLHVPACAAVLSNQTPPRGKDTGDGTRVQGLERLNRTTFGLFSRTRGSEPPCRDKTCDSQRETHCTFVLFSSYDKPAFTILPLSHPFCPLPRYLSTLRFQFPRPTWRASTAWKPTAPKYLASYEIYYLFFIKRKIQSGILHIFHLFLHIFHQIHHILFFKCKLYCLQW